MAAPKVLSLEVVAAPDGGKLFRAPADLWTVREPAYEGPEGKYYPALPAADLGSWRPYADSPFCEEMGSPCLLFRDGAFFDDGCIVYLGSRSDGYHLVDGFVKTEWQGTGAFGPPTDLMARWFKVGDIILIAYYPHPTCG